MFAAPPYLQILSIVMFVYNVADQTPNIFYLINRAIVFNITSSFPLDLYGLGLKNIFRSQFNIFESLGLPLTLK